MIKTNQERPDRRLRGVVADLATGCATYTRLVKGTGGAAAGRTRLDRERHKLCLREIVSRCGIDIQKTIYPISQHV